MTVKSDDSAKLRPITAVYGSALFKPWLIEQYMVGLVAEPAAKAGCFSGPAGLVGKILKYSYLCNLIKAFSARSIY